MADSDLGKVKQADPCAPCASSSLTAAGRTEATGFQGPELPLSVTRSHIHTHTHTLSLSFPLSISLSLSRTPSGYIEVERPLCASQYCVSTSPSPYSGHLVLKAPAAVFVSAGKTRPLELFDKSVFNHEPLLDNFIFLVWKFWSDGVNGRTNKINKTKQNK